MFVAYEHLRESLTKGNLWLYVLSALEANAAGPVELRKLVEAKHGFAPATITFYSVIYKLRKEGLVRKTSEAYRSNYEITPNGREELARARAFMDSIGKSL